MLRKILLFLVVGIMATTVASVAYADDDFVSIREKAELEPDRWQGMKSYTLSYGTNSAFADVTSGVGVSIYRVIFTTTAGSAGASIYDATGNSQTVTGTNATAASTTVFEIYEASTGGGHYIDFGDDPLVLTSGLSIFTTNAHVTVHYRYH